MVNCDSETDSQENITKVLFSYMKGEEGGYEKIWEKYISGKGKAFQLYPDWGEHMILLRKLLQISALLCK